jgi:hypothetical protein
MAGLHVPLDSKALPCSAHPIFGLHLEAVLGQNRVRRGTTELGLVLDITLLLPTEESNGRSAHPPTILLVKCSNMSNIDASLEGGNVRNLVVVITLKHRQ